MASKGWVKPRSSIKAEGSEWETKEERPNTPKLPNSEMEEEGAHGTERVTVDHNPPSFRWHDQYLAEILDAIGIQIAHKELKLMREYEEQTRQGISSNPF